LRKEYRKILIRSIIIISLIFAAAIIQTAPRLLPELFGGRVFLLIPVVVSICMFQSVFSGAAAGILAGAVWDISAGTPDGFLALLFGAAGFGIAFLSQKYIKNNIKTALLFSAAASLVFIASRIFFNLFYFNFTDTVYFFLSVYWPSFILTMAVSPFVYWFIRRILKEN